MHSSATTPAPAGGGFRAATVALRNRDFRIFFIAALISNTGGWMQNAAIPYVIFKLTATNGGVGVSGFFTYLPIMLMGAAGGSLADRFDRKRLLVVTQVTQAMFAAALWLLVARHLATPMRLNALAFGSGLAGGLNIPIWQSFVGQLVPKSILLNAVTLNSTQFNSARALGTFLAGLVIASFGADVVFAVNAVSFGTVLVALSMIRGRGTVRATGHRSNAVADLVAGWRYVLSTPGIVSCCAAIIAIAGLASPLFAYLTASYGQEIFRVSGWRMGLLWGGGGIGSVLFAPVILTRGARLGRRRLLTIAMSGYGLSTVCVGLSPSWPWAVGALVVHGGAYLAIASALNTTIQLLAREDMRGRSLAVYIMCLTGALPLGLLAWGAAADHVGIRAVTITAGSALVAVTALFALSGRFDAMGAADAGS